MFARALCVALLAASGSAFAMGGSYTTSNVQVALIDLAPGDGIAPSLGGITVDGVKTFLESLSLGGFELQGFLGPQTAIQLSFNYTYTLEVFDLDTETAIMEAEGEAYIVDNYPTNRIAFGGISDSLQVNHPPPFTGALITKSVTGEWSGGTLSNDTDQPTAITFVWGATVFGWEGTPLPAVPEPGTVALMLAGLAALGLRASHRR